MGSPTFGDVSPDESLLYNLHLLDCRLMADDRDGMMQLLEENGELLRVIKGRLPKCLPDERPDRHATLRDFTDRLEDDNDGDSSDRAGGSSQSDSGCCGGQTNGGGTGDRWDDDDEDDTQY